MKNVHIVTVGFDPHPSLDMLASGDVDFIYLLNDRSDKAAVISEKAITSALDQVDKNMKYKVEEIDCYDYQSIYDKIMDIVDNEKQQDKKCKIHINFSRGTAIAVGAACTAACSIKDVDLYYSKLKSDMETNVSDRIIHVDVSDFSVYFQLKGKTKKVFSLFIGAVNDELSNLELMQKTGLEKNSLSHHTQKLVDLNLIQKEYVGRKAIWHITETGKKVLKRIA